MPPELAAALPWILSALAGAFFGWLITVLALSGRRARLEERIKSEERRLTELEARHASSTSESALYEANGQALRTQLAELRTRLEEESKAAAEKQALLDRAELRLQVGRLQAALELQQKSLARSSVEGQRDKDLVIAQLQAQLQGLKTLKVVAFSSFGVEPSA